MSNFDGFSVFLSGNGTLWNHHCSPIWANYFNTKYEHQLICVIYEFLFDHVSFAGFYLPMFRHLLTTQNALTYFKQIWNNFVSSLESCGWIDCMQEYVI